MFCENLKKIREEKKLTRKQMANLIGIPYTTYIGYETLAREPKKDKIEKIANTLNVRSSYIMGLSDVPYNLTFDDTPNDSSFNRTLYKIENSIELTAYEEAAYRNEYQKMLSRIPEVLSNYEQNISEFSKNMLLTYFELLNSSGKIEAIKRIEELTLISKYVDKE